MCMRETSHFFTLVLYMTIHKPILGTRYSGTVFITGAVHVHVQLHMDDVIGLIVDDVMIFSGLMLTVGQRTISG